MSIEKLNNNLGLKIYLSDDKSRIIIDHTVDGFIDHMELDEIDFYSLIRQLTHLHKEMPTAPLPWMTENDPDYYSSFPD